MRAIICINLDSFSEHKSEYWMKPDSKLWFDFIHTLELRVFTEGILDFSFYHPINQKILSTDRKQTHFTMF